jgi:hypothetical protein
LLICFALCACLLLVCCLFVDMCFIYKKYFNFFIYKKRINSFHIFYIIFIFIYNFEPISINFVRRLAAAEVDKVASI